jgi:hypothetical protein
MDTTSTVGSGLHKHRRSLALLGLLLTLVTAGPAPTHAVTVPYLEGLRPVAPDEVTTLGPDLFGDRVNLFNGSLEFEQTDLSLPGNNALPVALGRRHTPARDPLIRGPLGDWDLDLPSIGGVFLAEGWKTVNESFFRCSNFSTPPYRVGFVPSWDLFQAPASQQRRRTSSVRPDAAPASSAPPYRLDAVDILPSDYWQGTYLRIPGQGSQEVLIRASGYTRAPGGAPVPAASASRLVTHQNWRIDCLPSVFGGPGEGFVAVSPQGVRYTLNWMVSRQHPSLIKQTTETARAESGGQSAAAQQAQVFGERV